MKLIIVCLALAAFVSFEEDALAQGESLTFDDISVLPGWDLAPVPIGYGGLQWSNVWCLDGLNFHLPSGYSNAVVSPNNVAYGSAGATSYISGPSFDLISGYLTAAWNDDLQVQVRGYFDGTLIYDNTYNLITTGPALITFNYVGVNEVQFDSWGGIPHWTYPGSMFAMDNLLVSAVPEPSASALVGLAVAIMVSLRRLGKRGSQA